MSPFAKVAVYATYSKGKVVLQAEPETAPAAGAEVTAAMVKELRGISGAGVQTVSCNILPAYLGTPLHYPRYQTFGQDACTVPNDFHPEWETIVSCNGQKAVQQGYNNEHERTADFHMLLYS